MILHSESGYCMPFEEPQGKEVEMTLGYGEQTDPGTGKPFFHHGIDFNARYYRLSAVASGIVSGVGNDPVHGICQTIRYGEYEVTYGHLSNVFAQFGQRVKAGQTVALSGDRLHVEARFKGEELNPLEFLTMLYGNIRALRQAGGHETAAFPDLEMTVKTDYDKDIVLDVEVIHVYLQEFFICFEFLQTVKQTSDTTGQTRKIPHILNHTTNRERTKHTVKADNQVRHQLR